MPTAVPPPDFTGLIEYFERAPFAYLALDMGGRSVRLERAPVPPAVALSAPGVGTVAVRAQGATLPRPGERIRRGETIMVLRRFRSSIPLDSPTDGTLASIDVSPGQFVEFGQMLATLIPD